MRAPRKGLVTLAPGLRLERPSLANVLQQPGAVWWPHPEACVCARSASTAATSPLASSTSGAQCPPTAGRTRATPWWTTSGQGVLLGSFTRAQAARWQQSGLQGCLRHAAGCPAGTGSACCARSALHNLVVCKLHSGKVWPLGCRQLPWLPLLFAGAQNHTAGRTLLTTCVHAGGGLGRAASSTACCAGTARACQPSCRRGPAAQCHAQAPRAPPHSPLRGPPQPGTHACMGATKRAQRVRHARVSSGQARTGARLPWRAAEQAGRPTGRLHLPASLRRSTCEVQWGGHLQVRPWCCRARHGRFRQGTQPVRQRDPGRDECRRRAA